MEKIKLNYFSQTLQKKVEIIIFGNLENIQTIIIGLHGLGGDKYDFLNKTNLYNLVEQYNKTCVLVDGQRSFYINSEYGENYYDFIQEELLEKLEKHLKIKTKEMEKYIFGFSMGGYGALNYFLEEPQKYKGIASLSGTVDIIARDKIKRATENFIKIEWEKLFGKKINDKYDLFQKIQNQKEQLKNKKIFITCGTEDHLYQYNQKFINHLDENQITYQHIFLEGAHNYQTVDKVLPQMFEYFFN